MEIMPWDCKETNRRAEFTYKETNGENSRVKEWDKIQERIGGILKTERFKLREGVTRKRESGYIRIREMKVS